MGIVAQSNIIITHYVIIKISCTKSECCVHNNYIQLNLQKDNHYYKLYMCMLYNSGPKLLAFTFIVYVHPPKKILCHTINNYYN